MKSQSNIHLDWIQWKKEQFQVPFTVGEKLQDLAKENNRYHDTAVVTICRNISRK